MSFDKIIVDEALDLKTATVTIAGSDGKDYKFTVTELTPIEMSRCVDEFGDVDFIPVIYRSVRDQAGQRMSKQQANQLPPQVLGKFIEGYMSFSSPDKKKQTKKKTKT